MNSKKFLYFILASIIIFQNLPVEPKKEISNEWTTCAWSISKELFDYIRKILPEGSTIVELGSGWASEQLSKYYTVYSIEHSEKWLDKYNTNYIYAPIKNNWYEYNYTNI